MKGAALHIFPGGCFTICELERETRTHSHWLRYYFCGYRGKFSGSVPPPRPRGNNPASHLREVCEELEHVVKIRVREMLHEVLEDPWRGIMRQNAG